MTKGESVPQGKRFLLFPFIVAGTFLVAISGNLGLSYFNKGKSTKASGSICKLIETHLAGAAAIKNPKLMFIAGSNVRGGISAEGVADALRLPTYNFGLQAALGPRIILFEARKVLRPGDTAVLAFEYNHYSDDRWNDISSDVLFACGTDLLSSMSLSDIVEALFSVDPLRALKIERANTVGDMTAEFGNPESREPSLVSAWQYGDRPFSAFTPTSPDVERRLQLYQPIPIAFNPQARGPKAIAAFVHWAHANDVKVVATWPNTIYFPQYHNMEALKKIEQFYWSIGVPVIGTPIGAMYPTASFYDTQYHLLPTAIVQRTADIVSLLSENRWALPGNSEEVQR